MFSQLLATFPASLANRDQNEVNEIRRQWVLAFRELVIPQSSFSHIITLAKESDDAAFVERVMVKTFHRESPVRDVAIKRYCNRNCTQDIARIISYITGADIQYCRKRVVWCEKVLESEMFYAMKRELEKEFPLIAA